MSSPTRLRVINITISDTYLQCAQLGPDCPGSRKELMGPQVVTESIRAGTPVWESLVPRHVVDEIKENKLVQPGPLSPFPPSHLPSPSGMQANS